MLITAVAAVLGPAPSGATTSTGSTHPRLVGVETFALALGVDLERSDTAARLAAYDLVVVDGESAPASLVEELQVQGVTVLGYLSVGTIERGRGWTDDAKPFRLDHWDDWDEWYAEVANPAFQSLIVDAIAPSILDRGFDGLFLDNVDMVETHPKQRRGMRKLVRKLAALVHARGGMLFAQNGESSIDPLLPYLDGWNREDVSGTYDFDTGTYVAQRPRDPAQASRGRGA